MFRKRLQEFFQDEKDQLSFGRLAAAFCLLTAILGFLIGAHYKEIADYCKKFVDAMLLSAAGFFQGSKLQQAIASFSGSSQNPPTPPPPAA